MQQKRYAKPPIVEAVIDLQTRSAAMPELAKIEQFCKTVADRFPLVSPIQAVTVNLPTPDAPAPDFSNQQVGYRLANGDNSRVLQVQQQGFSYSHLSSYTCWEDFVREAADYWVEYAGICEPEALSRIATRFINKLIVPKEKFDLEEYFNLYPTFPKPVNDDVIGVFMQTRQQIKDVPGATATITFTDTVENAGTPDAQVAFLLDFDLAIEGRWDSSEGDAWDILDKFRHVKNRYFESSITEKTRSLFE